MKRIPLVAIAALLVFAVPWSGCSQQATTLPVRSLERSGRASFVCLRDPSSKSPGQELDGCFTPSVAPAANDYGIPHVIGLVTQTTRGEVAVVDVTAGVVLDADPTTPGYNFLPVGAIPTDIASTPGGNATFVGSGDPVRPGIYAIPSSRLPYQSLSVKPTLASWPACLLVQGVPTELVVVPDRAMHPGRCDSSLTPAVPNPGYDLSNEASVFGRLKIVAAIPDASALVVIDAQELLAREPGSFDPCPVEQVIPLNPPTPASDAGVDGTAPDAGPSDAATASDDGAVADGASNASDAGADGDGGPPIDLSKCSGRITASPPANAMPHPVEMALADDGRLFVSDDRASVIHVIDLADPCTATEGVPLLPYSAADPTRVVVTNAIAVSPLTSDMKRYVYAVDARGGGNVMAFDVSQGSTERRPLLRPDKDLNPFEPPDRIGFSSPVLALTFANHDFFVDMGSTTGVVKRGIKCDPTATDSSNPGFFYRPQDFQSTGANPRRLRGTFAFVSLSNGRVGVVDIDDYDGPCRRPAASDDDALGCKGKLMLDSTHTLFSASGEASCNVVERHRQRSFQFFANAPNAGLNAPALQTFPLLWDKTGTVLSTDPTRTESHERPKLLGPSMASKTFETRMDLGSVVGSASVPDNPKDTTDLDLSSDPAKATHNWVAFDVREPRSHVDQTWSVVYEGVLPGLASRKGRFKCAADNKTAIDCESGADPSHFVLFDSSVGFCDQGAQGTALGQSMGLPGGDIVQIVEPLPDPADPYWGMVAGTCSVQSCQMVYGTPDDPRDGRDLAVDTAFEDRLVLQTNAGRGTSGAQLACCFPYPPAYSVRAGKHWIVLGSASGYSHHIILDPTDPMPATAPCIRSCDPQLALRNGRAIELPRTMPDPKDPTKMMTVKTPVPGFDDDTPSVFRNAQIRFVIWGPEMCTSGLCRQRDMYFQFAESGGFTPMEIGLSPIPVIVDSIRFVRGIDQLAVPDAVSQGLGLFDIGSLSANGTKWLF